MMCATMAVYVHEFERGEEALSKYDKTISSGGDVERALWTVLYLTGNHVRYFTENVEECDRLPRQATLFGE